MTGIYFPDKEAMYARNPRLQFIADRLGTRNWCVAHRLTERLKRQGYERVVTSTKLEAIEREWEHANPDDARQYGGRLLHELRLSDDELAIVKWLWMIGKRCCSAPAVRPPATRPKALYAQSSH